MAKRHKVMTLAEAMSLGIGGYLGHIGPTHPDSIFMRQGGMDALYRLKQQEREKAAIGTPEKPRQKDEDRHE